MNDSDLISWEAGENCGSHLSFELLSSGYAAAGDLSPTVLSVYEYLYINNFSCEEERNRTSPSRSRIGVLVDNNIVIRMHVEMG